MLFFILQYFKPTGGVYNMERKQLNPKMLASEAASYLNISVQAVHKKIKSNNLEVGKSQNRVYCGHSTAKELFKIEFDPKIYTFHLVKGGVGKTAMAFLFALRSALYGAKVLLIEIDQQANLTRSCGIDSSELPVMIDVLTQSATVSDCIVNVLDGVDIIPSRVDNALLDNTLMLQHKKYPLDKVYKTLFDPLKSQYDVIVIDCPPSIGSSVSAAAIASDVVVMPVNPTDYSLSGLDLTYKELSEITEQFGRHIDVRILFNKFDGRTKLSFNVLSDLIKHEIYGPKMIKTYVRTNQQIENTIANGGSIFETVRNTPEKDDIDTLTRELLGI